MIARTTFIILIVAYVALSLPFAGYLRNRPVEVKLGYLPHPQLLKVVTGAHAPTVAQMARASRASLLPPRTKGVTCWAGTSDTL